MAPPLENVRPMFELRGRNYIVTGGAQGIGFASTRAICELGGNAAVLDVQNQPAEAEFHSLANLFGVRTFYIHTDVAKQDSLEKGFAAAVESLGGRLDGLTWEEFTRIQEINGRGLFFTCQLAARQMIAQATGGSMVLLASQTSHIAIPGHRMAAYNYSKGGVLMLTKALAVELAPHAIHVSSISPGFVDSDMLQRVRAAKEPEEAAQMEKSPPLSG
ncbi:uncharacterized protein HMPREF1541_11085 [Cyphellophora europaea CBS 101466]|uniref:Uncharacterized protein n=1 Tax=Cyphellophora europaea (strain CBS 101466) TaxID=1220924 RepID=W2S4Z2_CYPE1|nr:uncharacterized protein HMPREF1541_11085 [Cyphellophora europaea CBS 101466]ETN43761.1 hypothetical protein HMPREF1541_11085 [Cyphellophora europaea CBS 101466]